MYTTTEPRHIAVRSELDIVTLRHTVRQFARGIGLDLPRQAKITVAISAVARAFIGDHNHIVFTVQVAHRLPRSALEISCIASCTGSFSHTRVLENQLNVQDIHLLVDEFTTVLKDNAATLTMRMWLAA